MTKFCKFEIMSIACYICFCVLIFQYPYSKILAFLMIGFAIASVILMAIGVCSKQIKTSKKISLIFLHLLIYIIILFIIGYIIILLEMDFEGFGF